MQRINSQTLIHRTLARKLLMWLTFAERNLSLIELQQALAIEAQEDFDNDNMPDMDLAMSVCSGLVIHDKESNSVRFVHITAWEYFNEFRDDVFPNAATQLLHICLTYLTCSSVRSLAKRYHRQGLEIHFGSPLHWEYPMLGCA